MFCINEIQTQPPVHLSSEWHGLADRAELKTFSEFICKANYINVLDLWNNTFYKACSTLLECFPWSN